MAGTKAGGLKTRATNYQKYGKDHYRRIGAIGGRKSNTGGFSCMDVDNDGLTGPERSKIAGSKGGKIGGFIGKRGYAFIELAEEKGFAYYKQRNSGNIVKLAINN